jgi:hypothetical protein
MNCRGYCQRTEIHRTTPHFLRWCQQACHGTSHHSAESVIGGRRGGLAVGASGRWRWSAGRITDFAIGFTRRAGNTSARCRTALTVAAIASPPPTILVRVREPWSFARPLCRPLPYHRNGRLGRRLEVAHLTFDDKSGGQIGFGASKDFRDVRCHAISKGDASERVASQWT